MSHLSRLSYRSSRFESSSIILTIFLFASLLSTSCPLPFQKILSSLITTSFLIPPRLMLTINDLACCVLVFVSSVFLSCRLSPFPLYVVGFYDDLHNLLHDTVFSKCRDPDEVFACVDEVTRFAVSQTYFPFSLIGSFSSGSLFFQFSSISSSVIASYTLFLLHHSEISSSLPVKTTLSIASNNALFLFYEEVGASPCPSVVAVLLLNTLS